jgi:hypothetical protein
VFTRVFATFPGRTDGVEPLFIVDGANVVGSVPDGWWRDRAGAARRLRDALGARPEGALPGEVVLVVEGAARGVEPVPGVRVESAAGSGDDLIVDLVRNSSPERHVTVVTADRGLRERVGELGAEVVGPGGVRAAIRYGKTA